MTGKMTHVTTLNQGPSEGKTRTQAVYLEDTWHIEDHWSVYIGGRYEWWRGFDARQIHRLRGCRKGEVGFGG